MNLLDVILAPQHEADDFDDLISYFRQPLASTNLEELEQRSLEIQQIQRNLRDRMAGLVGGGRRPVCMHEGRGEQGIEHKNVSQVTGWGNGSNTHIESERDNLNYIEDEGEYWSEGEGAAQGEAGGGPVRRRQRRLPKPRQPYSVNCAARSTNWFERSLAWSNEDFRAMYRVSKKTFWNIVDILQSNSAFQSTGRKPQRPVHHQLAVFLLRYGATGSRERFPKLLLSVGEGTVSLYCRRVIRAIREYGVAYIQWPTGERKEEIKRGFKKICGLEGIVGALDGTLCGLETKPRVEGNSYISRKKTLSVNVQAIVDHKGWFLAFQSGWPGSRPDSAVWPHMWVYSERSRLFTNGEFLLADGGYQLSPYVLIPFAKNELSARRREFNRKISRARIVVEWAFGRLKARFPALKRLGVAHDIKNTYRAIEAMMVLHNVCFDLGDAPEFSRSQLEDQESEDSEGEDIVNDQEEQYGETTAQSNNESLLMLGRAFRERCIDTICPQWEE